MNSNRKNDDDDELKVEMLSIGSGILSGLLQYKNLADSKMKIVPKGTVCVLTFLLCYGVTNVALRNIYQLNK